MPPRSKRPPKLDLAEALRLMTAEYQANPSKAVRSQAFIKHLHRHLAEELDSRLTRWARKTRGVHVKKEAKLLGVAKDKSVDVAVIDPQNGPLLIIGARSQMSSVGKNVPGYFEGVIGDAMALQERFPMSTHGYVYLHPLTVIKASRTMEKLNHARYAAMYASITGRSGTTYRSVRGVFDQFAYLVVDFTHTPAELRDDIVTSAVPDPDLSVTTFVDRMIATFKSRVFTNNDFFS